MSLFVGVDVGGSAVKLGAVTEGGERRGETSVAVGEGMDARAIFAAVGAAARELTGGEPAGLGVGLPGLLDRDRGIVESSPNLPWLEREDVAEHLSSGTGVPRARIRLENDANVAALGELWLGAARGEGNLVFLTLGTGVGGAVVLGGELFVGAGLAGEVGHLTIDPDGMRCGCGSVGCLETLASATAARRRAAERGLTTDLEDLTESARGAAGPERELLEDLGLDLGHGLGLVLSLLDIRLFVFGGGFSAALDVLEPGIRRGLEEWTYGSRVAAVRLERARLGPSAGWIGAARLLVP